MFMEFIVEEQRERLDKFLASRFAGFSRSRLQKFIKNSAFKVNSRPIAKSGFILKRGDRVLVLEKKITPAGTESFIEPETDIPLDIVYEDEDIVVVNKPAGLLVHPTLSQRRHTLVNALLARYPEISKVGENPLRPGIVHRLDKDTSGLLIAARNQKAFYFLKNQFLARSVVKKYFALVKGAPKEKEGVIRYAIRPSKSNRLKKVAVKESRLDNKRSTRIAETAYKIRKIIGGKFSLLEVSPKTGRTHQIRVHLAAIGHPIVGDSLYGGEGNSVSLKRQFLHAYYLKFITPSGAPLALEIDLPPDLQKIIDDLSG